MSFMLKEKKDIPTLGEGSKGTLVKHISGAKVLLIKTDDDNQVFSANFFNAPDNNRGAAHVLEHCLLTGSRKYPDNPFARLRKGVLWTYLNALTYKDRTLFPAASRDETSFREMIDVYMDGVIHPIITKRIFEVEKRAAISEMETFYNDTFERAKADAYAKLFLGTPYAYSSAGIPEEMRKLSYEEIINFFDRHYIPNNALLYLYGNDPEKYLPILDIYLNELLSLDRAVSAREYESRNIHAKATRDSTFENRHFDRRWTRAGAPRVISDESGGCTFINLGLWNSYEEELIIRAAFIALQEELSSANAWLDIEIPFGVIGFKTGGEEFFCAVADLIENGKVRFGRALDTLELRLRVNYARYKPRGLTYLIDMLPNWFMCKNLFDKFNGDYIARLKEMPWTRVSDTINLKISGSSAPPRPAGAHSRKGMIAGAKRSLPFRSGAKRGIGRSKFHFALRRHDIQTFGVSYTHLLFDTRFISKENFPALEKVKKWFENQLRAFSYIGETACVLQQCLPKRAPFFTLRIRTFKPDKMLDLIGDLIDTLLNDQTDLSVDVLKSLFSVKTMSVHYAGKPPSEKALESYTEKLSTSTEISFDVSFYGYQQEFVPRDLKFIETNSPVSDIVVNIPLDGSFFESDKKSAGMAVAVAALTHNYFFPLTRERAGTYDAICHIAQGCVIINLLSVADVTECAEILKRMGEYALIGENLRECVISALNALSNPPHPEDQLIVEIERILNHGEHSDARRYISEIKNCSARDVNEQVRTLSDTLKYSACRITGSRENYERFKNRWLIEIEKRTKEEI
ncbi:MAG: insulinase family protein [Clostridiales bacterium]|jgi:hypothetical protein|nr:insulinase family protein [Clostridiales bacterium]